MTKKSKITKNKITTTVKFPKAQKNPAKAAKGPKGPGVIDTILAVLKDGGGLLETIVGKVRRSSRPGRPMASPRPARSR